MTAQRPSPHQIRRQASVAFRNRTREAIAGAALPLRYPDLRETPLSAEEVKVGIALGLIHSARARAFAQET